MANALAVYVRAADRRLQDALSVLLGKLSGLELLDAPRDAETMTPYSNGLGPLPTLVLSPTRDLSSTECRALAERGLAVIVLAPVFREKDRTEYLNAGAYAYVEMDISNRGLLEVVRQLRDNVVTGARTPNGIHVPMPDR